MSLEIIHICPNCGFSLAVWDEGHPYIKDPEGTKHPFFHPSEQETILPVVMKYSETAGMTHGELMEFARQHIGCERDVICLDCANQFRAATQKPPKCRSCKSVHTVWAWRIGGKRCPKCKETSFPKEGRHGAIS